MDAVAAEARVSKQSLYAAYPSKSALFAAVIRDWVDQGYDASAPLTAALAETSDVRAGLLTLVTTLQRGVLSEPVTSIRRLVAAESETMPEVAADYLARSWGRNMRLLADALRTLDRRGLLTVGSPEVAADQLVWLTLGPALNQLTLQGTGHPFTARQLARSASEGVETFLSRYAVHRQVERSRAVRT
jgi:AcrR family transcriptional regulator